MSKIQWTNETWNPVIGCRRVSEGCRNCYAMSQAARIVSMSRGRGSGDVHIGSQTTPSDSPYERVVKFDDQGLPRAEWNGRAVFLPERLGQPLRWRKPRKVFVNSMSDLFHEDLSFGQIAAVFGVMAAAPEHQFQVLTKRPEQALRFFKWLRNEAWPDPPVRLLLYFAAIELHDGTDADYDRWRDRLWSAASASLVEVAGGEWRSPLGYPWPLPNVWLGVSVEDQATADERIPLLLECPAAVRWVSAEPLLGPVDFIGGRINHFKAYREADTVTELLGHGDGVRGYPRPGRGWVHYSGTWPDWVVVGGESGPNARPCDVAWIRSIVEQCRDAEVPAFVKQLGTKPSVVVTPEEEATLPPRGPCADPSAPLMRVLNLKDRKGGDPGEWPADLRVREYPTKEEDDE